MHLIVIHNKNDSANNDSILLDGICAGELVGGVILDSLMANCRFNGNSKAIIALPKATRSALFYDDIIYYDRKLPISDTFVKKSKSEQWSVISNGRFIADINHRLIRSILTNVNEDVIAINTEPALLSYREDIRIGSGGGVAGVRRIYADSVLPCQMPSDWPAHIFIKTNLLDTVLSEGPLPMDFSDFVKRCDSKSLKWRCFTLGATAFDLETEAGLLNLLTKETDLTRHLANQRPGCKISNTAQIFGQVMTASNVEIEDGAVIVGPAILDENVRIGRGAVIKRSAIAANLTIADDSLVQNRVLINPLSAGNLPSTLNRNDQIKTTDKFFINPGNLKNTFRTWPVLSYAGCVKRIADIIFAVVVLVLFTPILPIIAIAIKLNSRGPVFFRHKRQGLHGEDFSCLKFRTMIVGADEIQGKLRSKNQVDGPQFKVENDPRVTAVGRFLRDTFIDEIPQFINILLGQMSVVGPRPSPKTENSFCPAWRDARLSVRPGVTGLWQIQRTRKPDRDFQEWIYYDSKYVKKMSLKLDLWICWQTFKKITMDFAKKF